MWTAITGNTAKEVFNVVIVNRRFVLFFLKYRFRHRLGTGIVLSEKEKKLYPSLVFSIADNMDVLKKQMQVITSNTTQ